MKTDWWKGGVIYQIYPRSFQDTTGDGIGDLTGIAQRLPYVASLGVDAVWISPFFNLHSLTRQYFSMIPFLVKNDKGVVDEDPEGFQDVLSLLLGQLARFIVRSLDR